MSKISLPIAELKPALVGLSKIIGRSSTLPVLQSIRVDRTKDGWTTLTSTDLDRFITVRLEQPAEGAPDSMLVPYEHLNRITKRCGRPDTITVSKADGDKILFEFPIGNQTGQEHVESLPVADYPPIPKIKTDAVPIKDDIRQAILEAMDCASTDETRVILNGAYLDVSSRQGHYVVATDGRHLYSSNSFTLPLQNSLIIPDHKFLGWKEFNNDGEWQLRVQPGVKDNPGLLQISSRRWRYITRQIEGNYPNWQQVVPDPKQYNTTVELTPAAMDAILALVPKIPCHDAINNPIGLIVEGKKLTLRGRGANDSKWTDLGIEGVTVKGKPVTVYVNRDFLTKALTFGMNTIEMIDPLTPLKFSNGGKQMIVMPIRASDPAPTVASPSTPSPASPPATPPPAAEPTSDAAPSSTERSTTMPRISTTGNTATNGAATTNGNGNGQSHEAATAKPAIEVALEKIETIKGSYREAIRGLNDLADTLKQAQREQKGTDKEVQSIRVTLEKLQSVRI
jgi:DNA polymerase III sliding clamp (beta) subunit (PCNA family)